MVLVDYAHTPDGLRSVLIAARAITTGRLICLFGCGGDRDSGKRDEMGRIAGEGADICVLTDDNPRGEDPAAIRVQAEAGLRETGAKYEVVGGRGEAIERALLFARSGDTVVLAGKGHENVQIIGDRRVPFLDRAVAEEALDRIGRGRG